MPMPPGKFLVMQNPVNQVCFTPTPHSDDIRAIIGTTSCAGTIATGITIDKGTCAAQVCFSDTITGTCGSGVTITVNDVEATYTCAIVSNCINYTLTSLCPVVAGDVVKWCYDETLGDLVDSSDSEIASQCVETAIAYDVPTIVLTGIDDQSDPVRGAITPLDISGDFDSGDAAGSEIYSADLPTGLTINPGTGVISGTLAKPTLAQVYPSSVTLVTDGGSVTDFFNWTLTAVDPVWIPSLPAQNLPEVNPPVNFSLLTYIDDNGGDPNLVFSLDGTSAALPADLSLAADGLITGDIDPAASDLNPYLMVYSVVNSTASPVTANQTINVVDTVAPAEWSGLPFPDQAWDNQTVQTFDFLPYIQVNGSPLNTTTVELASGTIPPELSIVGYTLTGTLTAAADDTLYQPVFRLVTSGVGNSTVDAQLNITVGIVNPELLLNCSFETDLSSWQNDSSYWQWSSNSGGSAYHPLTTDFYKLLQVPQGGFQAGTTYEISFSIELIGATSSYRVQTRANPDAPSIVIDVESGTGVYTKTLDYTANANDYSIIAARNSAAAATEMYVRYLCIKEKINP